MTSDVSSSVEAVRRGQRSQLSGASALAGERDDAATLVAAGAQPATVDWAAPSCVRCATSSMTAFMNGPTWP